MRRLLAGLLCGALLGSAQAEESPQAIAPDAASVTLTILPGRLGYAFEQPQILMRQRLFGLAHGLSLLAAACLDLPEHSKTIQNSYAAWHEQQAATIEALVRDLSQHYFGARAGEAQWQDLARALKLNDSIQLSLGQVGLPEACASLPEAIARPRYQLNQLLAETDAPTGPARAPVAVAPAPTFADPGAMPEGAGAMAAQPKEKPAE